VTRTPLIVGNWKMNTTRQEAVDLAISVAATVPSNIDAVVCPPFPWLIDVHAVLVGSNVKLGAQNCWSEPSGAFTGEVSPQMLAEICEYVIVGHSERRRIISETDQLVAAKLRAALMAGLRVILCVGEDLETRQAGGELQFVQAQLVSALDGLDEQQLARCAVAYEPIWAIGTGVAAEPIDAQTMSAAIRRNFAPRIADSMRILYGGSVSDANAMAILGQDDVDGALVGGASLKAESFAEIIAAASRCA
jgi:triosephosphate isomerase (TIM)